MPCAWRAIGVGRVLYVECSTCAQAPGSARRQHTTWLGCEYRRGAWLGPQKVMLSGSEPQRAKPPKPLRRRRGAQLAPELDARAAEMRLRQSSTKEETELAEKHLQLLRSVELVGPATSTWVAVTCYLVIIMACATSHVASTVGLDTVVNTSLAKVRTMQS